jgi:hypothetical protein
MIVIIFALILTLEGNHLTSILYKSLFRGIMYGIISIFNQDAPKIILGYGTNDLPELFLMFKIQ